MSKISQLVSALAGEANKRPETVILLTGQTISVCVVEIGFRYNEYLAKYGEHKLKWKGNCWMEY